MITPRATRAAWKASSSNGPSSLLADGGVLALVCPEDVASSYTTADFFEEQFERVSAMPFPDEGPQVQRDHHPGLQAEAAGDMRHYGRHDWDWLDKRMEAPRRLQAACRAAARQFRKSEPTDAELARLVAQSPLRFHIQRPADKLNYRPRPPMSPGIGHRAMLLASGHIDGLICPTDEPPHVIRGTATKDKYVASCDESEDDNGNVTTRTVISERPRLVIRVLDSQGNITTLE